MARFKAEQVALGGLFRFRPGSESESDPSPNQAGRCLRWCLPGEVVELGRPVCCANCSGGGLPDATGGPATCCWRELKLPAGGCGLAAVVVVELVVVELVGLVEPANGPMKLATVVVVAGAACCWGAAWRLSARAGGGGGGMRVGVAVSGMRAGRGRGGERCSPGALMLGETRTAERVRHQLADQLTNGTHLCSRGSCCPRSRRGRR